MAGKSTFLRQNALIAVLAQMGSFVPARARPYRRGRSPVLAASAPPTTSPAAARPSWSRWSRPPRSSTRPATARLVILDEIGRGTATFDGLSIAWATIEHLHEVNRCRALFATHYHELTALAAKLPRLALPRMRVKEWQGEVVFLHEVGAGAADRSYGIHVARLAGLPAAVIGRAETILHSLEKGEQSSAVAKLADDLPLFAAAARQTAALSVPGPTPLAAALAEIDPDALTPRQALEALYRLKGLA